MARRLLAVWAHPDDEAFGPVGTMRLAHELGYQTAVITATRGDAGNSDLAQLAPEQTLGDLRENELRCSCRVLGVDRLDVWRYADGGLQDVPADELIARVGAVMREWQPQIVITFGPDGVTGHPDHVAISAATQRAFDQLRGEPGAHGSQRLYFHTVRPDQNIEHPMGEAPPPKPASLVIDVSAYEAIKRQALECHASQKSNWGPLLNDRDWLTVDRLYRVFPPVAPATPIETTIFDE